MTVGVRTDLLTLAIETLHAVPVMDRYARKCNDPSDENFDRWFILAPGVLELYAEDLARSAPSPKWGEFVDRMPTLVKASWWTPQHPFAIRFAHGSYRVPSLTLSGLHVMAREYAGAIVVTVDLATGEEIAA